MRYKYTIKHYREYLYIMNAKFIIEIDSVDKWIQIKSPTHWIPSEVEKIEGVDLLFNQKLIKHFLEAIQRILYFNSNFNMNKTNLGIKIYVKSYEKIQQRITDILQDIEKNYNPTSEVFFKYDLSNKEFAMQLLKYHEDIYADFPDEIKMDKEVVKVFSNCDRSCFVPKEILNNKELLLIFLNGRNNKFFNINTEMLDDEIIDLLINKEFKFKLKGAENENI